MDFASHATGFVQKQDKTPLILTTLYLTPKVEVCSGDAQFTRALWSLGYHGKAYDVSWWYSKIKSRTCGTMLQCSQDIYLPLTMCLPAKIRYSKNHDLMRSVGFVTILAAVGAIDFDMLIKSACCKMLCLFFACCCKVRNIKRGGLLMFAPPCNTWIFLKLGPTNENRYDVCLYTINFYTWYALYPFWSQE